jgi:hypothetical protein
MMPAGGKVGLDHAERVLGHHQGRYPHRHVTEILGEVRMVDE